MLLNINKNVLIWTPYKNYSTSLHAHFRGPNGWVMVIGSHTLMPAMFGPHTNTFNGPNAGELLKILPVRNPFERVVSMWRFNQKYAEPGKKMTFSEWFDATGQVPLNGPVVTQYEHDVAVRCEHLAEDLEPLGVSMEGLPWENKSENKEEIELTDKQKDIIRWFHRPDFEAGSYDTELA